MKQGKGYILREDMLPPPKFFPELDISSDNGDGFFL